MNVASRDLPEVLAVDLDGTLLRSNMLHETFWSAFAGNWRTPFVAARHLFKGRAVLKDVLAQRSHVDVAHLPYDHEIIDFTRAWRERGGRAVLVTATNQKLAQQIADHLGIFDEAIGSDSIRNLKGANKAAFLVERYGHGNYAYVGDAHADISVWRASGHAVVKSRSPRLRNKASAAQTNVQFVNAHRGEWRALAKALRPHQWLKNLLVFAAVIAAHRFDPTTLLNAFAAFMAFNLVASSVYLVNDLLDLSADRAHPRKRNRPFASGNARIEHGLPVTILLLLSGLGLSLLINPAFVAVMLAYYVTTTAYSLVLKRHTIIDICTLTVLYTIRVLAGGVATGIPISVWLLAFSVFFFFSLAAVKRQAELVDAARAKKLKIHGRGYHSDDLPLIAQMATASGYVSTLVMALYVDSEAVTRLYAHPEALWGISLVLLYWISRMTFIAHRGEMHDDPLVFAARDRVSLACAALILVFAVVGTIP